MVLSGRGQYASPTPLPPRQLEPGVRKAPQHSSSAKMGPGLLVWLRRRPREGPTEPTCHHRQWRRRQRCDRGHPAYSSTRPYRSNRSARSSEPNVYPAGPLRLLQRGCSDTIARCLSISRSTRRIHSGVPSTRSSTSCTVAVSSPTRRTQVMPSEPGLEIRMLWTGFANFVSYLTNITSH